MSIRRPPESAPWPEVMGAALAGLALGSLAGLLVVAFALEVLAAVLGEPFLGDDTGMAAPLWCVLGAGLGALAGAVWLPSTFAPKERSKQIPRRRAADARKSRDTLSPPPAP